jgi:uncharacterized protein
LKRGIEGDFSHDRGGGPVPVLDRLLAFTRTVRDHGVPVTAASAALLAEAVAATGVGRRDDVKAAARTVLAGRREHVEVVDRAFDRFFRAAPGREIPMGSLVERKSRKKTVQALRPAASGAEPEGEELEAPYVELVRAAGDRELLRRKDFAELTEDETAAVSKMIREAPLRLRPRRTRRLVRARRGRALDPRRTLRDSLSRGGEPLELKRRKQKLAPRPLVVLLDVSGSMETYARMLLQLAYALRGSTARLEVFAFGTRLTRLTRELEQRDLQKALADATAEVVDWGGGTRIGESLRRFHRDWGRRVLGRGAVVLLISDGWDRGDPEVLSRQMARLSRNCQRLIWLNPLLGRPGYEPLTRGMQAALPHVDDFLPVHDLVSLEQLGELLAAL